MEREINGVVVKIQPGADLRRANLHRADLYGANLYGANLYGADLYGADLYRANLRRADLYGADLYRANLYRADLRRADLRRADLYGANLRRANLRRADLYGANLYGANLRRAKIRFPKFPSISFLSNLQLGELSDSLTRELMRRDAAAHPHPKRFEEWAKREGLCPYGEEMRFWLFEERKNCWKKGKPQMSDLELIKAICKEKGWEY